MRLVSSESETALREAFATASGHVGCGAPACEFRPRAREVGSQGVCRCKGKAFATSALAGLYRAVCAYLEGVRR